LAYCGGRIKKNRRITHSCGCSPLILGVNNLCEAILEPENTICNHLICERCGFCQQNCPGYINRKIIKFSRYKLLNKPQPNISYNDKSDKTKLYELSLNVAKTKNAKLHKEIKN
ncbi:hypothetical protein, partial [Picosynechococcus sp. NKBG042902]|uniref:hypothetical protein n=1 Tax=Picosynechococcus sp. NKBG042902 TaxID=490193 RepID=UPI001C113456